MTAATLFTGTTSPVRDVHSEPFWQAAAAGRLMLPRCRACGKAHWYPRPFCPFCYGDVEWQEASGRGTLYSYSVTAIKAGAYVLALVALEEGPLILTNIICDDVSELAIEQPVAVRFETASNGERLPAFAPGKSDDA